MFTFHPSDRLGYARPMANAGAAKLEMKLTAFALSLCLGLSSLSTGAHAAEAAKKITLELNDLQTANAACRAVFVLHNGLDKAVDKLALRVVAFDAKQHASLFLSLDVGV